MEIFENAYAKLNLSLDIVSKMDDGYHDMKMIFQTVDICDDITVRITDNYGIRITSNAGYIPCDENNIAAKAAKLFLSECGKDDVGVDINIFKRIPVCAGMGGGSADGAAVLRGLNKIFNYPVSTERLLEIGNEVGSDVPFCIVGGTVLGCGRGNIMTDLAPLGECSIVVCKPSFSVSTPALFKRINCKKIKFRPDTEGMISALEHKDIKSLARRMYNVFEEVLPSGRDTINSIKNTFYDFGALGTVMTGSGSAVFAVFENEDSSASAYEYLKTEYKDCFIAKPVGKLL